MTQPLQSTAIPSSDTQRQGACPAMYGSRHKNLKDQVSRQITAEVAIQPKSPFGADHLPAFHGVWVFSVGDGRRMPYSMTRFPERLLVCSEAENALI